MIEEKRKEELKIAAQNHFEDLINDVNDVSEIDGLVEEEEMNNEEIHFVLSLSYKVKVKD